MSDVLAVIVIAIVFLLAVAINVVLMPFLLMVVLGALGYSFSFWVCLAFWLVAVALFKLIRG